MHPFARAELLLGREGLARLARSKVTVFGVGGVGSYVVEALARAGIGKLVLIDSDRIEVSNLNRQLGALHSTLDRVKVNVYQERILDINPQAEVKVFQEFVSAENIDSLVERDADYLVDAIDTVTAKLLIIEKGRELGIPVISAMGTGNRLDPARLRIGDIGETTGCPLARVMRRELRKRGLERGLKVVYSIEPAVKPLQDSSGLIPANSDGEQRISAGRSVPGSVSFVPSAAGLLLAAQVVKDLLGKSQ